MGICDEGTADVVRTARWQQLDAGSKFQLISSRLLEVDRFIKVDFEGSRCIK